MVGLGTKLYHAGMHSCRIPYGKTVHILMFVVDSNSESLSISALLISNFNLMKISCISTRPSIVLIHANSRAYLRFV